MKVKREYKNTPILIIVVVIVFYFGLRLGTLVELNDGDWSLEVITEASNQLLSFEPLILNKNTLLIGGFLSLFAWMIYETIRTGTKKNMQEEAFGSAKWNNADYTRNLREKSADENWIFTQTEIVSMNMQKTERNRNCTIIGRPGTGKSRYWLIPNILNAGVETLIITDPKEEVLKATGYSLKKKGFDIRVFNIKSKWRSNHYNPLRYIRKLPKEAYLLDLESDTTRKELMEKRMDEGKNIAEDDVMSLINSIMENTKSETIESNTGDPFWEKAEMVFLQALFYYVIFKLPESKRNFRTILELIREGEPKEKDGKSLDSALKQRFDQWAEEEPDNIGVKQWKHFIVSQKSPKMMSTIIMTASARLAPFNLAEVDRMTSDDTMELERIGKPWNSPDNKDGSHTHGKVAYFIVTNPNDGAFNFLANLMYTQIFNIIDQNATDNGGQLSTPCNVWMDEFRQLGQIPRFLENWAYVRGLNCGITIILQSLSQFKKLYKEEWETGLDCCDYILFLGSRSKETLEYISQMLGKQTLYKKSSGRTFSRQGSSSQNWDVYGRELATIDELSEMEKGHGILLMSGTKPFYSKLYDLKADPNYKDLWEAWTEIRGDKEPEFRKTKEWKKNHEKLYDHLKELKVPQNVNEERFEEMMHQMGLKSCRIMSKSTVHDCSPEMLKRMFPRS